jgi:hypothetical protein
MNLPIFFTKHMNSKMTSYVMIDQSGKQIAVECNYGDYAIVTESHDDIDRPNEVQNIIDRATQHWDVSIISAEVFMHHFSVAHRELFYNVNPALRPHEEKQLG